MLGVLLLVFTSVFIKTNQNLKTILQILVYDSDNIEV